MQNNLASLSTHALMNMIRLAPDEFGALLKQNGTGPRITLPTFLKRHMAERDISAATLMRESLLSKSFVYQILDGTRSPGRDALICIALALRLSVEDAQRLLTLGEKGQLYPKVRRDAALLCCIVKSMSPAEANEFLAEIGEAPVL